VRLLSRVGYVIVSTVAVLAAVAPPAPARVAHTVEPGETLWSIALANNLTTRLLAAANGLPPTAHILAGNTISVPSVSEPATARAEQVQPGAPLAGGPAATSSAPATRSPPSRPAAACQSESSPR
jgi:LysM repeat protein